MTKEITCPEVLDMLWNLGAIRPGDRVRITKDRRLLEDILINGRYAETLAGTVRPVLVFDKMLIIDINWTFRREHIIGWYRP